MLCSFPAVFDADANTSSLAGTPFLSFFMRESKAFPILSLPPTTASKGLPKALSARAITSIKTITSPTFSTRWTSSKEFVISFDNPVLPFAGVPECNFLTPSRS
jgi:hypothetical protein